MCKCACKWSVKCERDEKIDDFTVSSSKAPKANCQLFNVSSGVCLSVQWPRYRQKCFTQFLLLIFLVFQGGKRTNKKTINQWSKSKQLKTPRTSHSGKFLNVVVKHSWNSSEIWYVANDITKLQVTFLCFNALISKDVQGKLEITHSVFQNTSSFFGILINK